MGNRQWPFRLAIGIIFAVVLVGYSFLEAGRQYDFVQSCRCGLRTIYNADRTGYIMGEVAAAALMSIVVVGAALAHPLWGILALSAVFAVTGLLNISTGSPPVYGAVATWSEYDYYLQMIGKTRLAVGGVCFIATLVAATAFIMNSRREAEAANKSQA